MEYQVVLQFRGDSLGDYDSMNSLEDALIEELADIAEVDGHDVGSRETNIFLKTSEPASAFTRAKAVLGAFGLLGKVAAAYRPVGGNSFTVLWPHQLHFFSVA
jgi:hypothetical protein